jgi:hypothetical protein
VWIHDIIIVREGESYFPAFTLHQDDCQGKDGCCDFRYEKLQHLRSDDLEIARQNARDLANRAQAPLRA